ncbi:MAG: 2Fe-2S iron-sulfur cluster-binding protein [Halioglobus sp.]
MARITLIEHNGQDHTIDAESGVSLMQNVMNNLVPGIDADCGGAGACGTCHCFIEDPWRTATGNADPMEESMLGMRPDRVESSRLSCQIDVSDDMDGMVVRLPEFQM